MLKLIGGSDAGRFLPYAFVGLSDIQATDGPDTRSDRGTNYGLGARVALGAQGRFVSGLEYPVEEKDNFGGGAANIKNMEIAPMLDYRF